MLAELVLSFIDGKGLMSFISALGKTTFIPSICRVGIASINTVVKLLRLNCMGLWPMLSIYCSSAGIRVTSAASFLKMWYFFLASAAMLSISPKSTSWAMLSML